MRKAEILIKSFFLALVLFILPDVNNNCQAQDELDVMPYWSHLNQGGDAFYQYFVDRAIGFLTERKQHLDNVHTSEQARQYQERIQEKLKKVIGPFPEKTPLNPKITGTIEKEDFIVEKLYYESRPNYYVTAALFIPRVRQDPAPAIVYCSGHSDLGFRSETYQHIILNYVAKGFIVLAFDPIGQGERLQYTNEDGSHPYRPTQEHSYPGTQSFMAGLSPANFLIWDGVRAIDYLESQPEVDSGRIGIAGRSGGGTQSAYIAAIDPRVKVAAPECYLTTFEMLLHSRGPQDAEQNMMHGIAEGLDHADYVIARAPRPTLMVTTTRDIFSIEGAREVYQEAKSIYAHFDASENLAKVEDDAGHASTLKNREASYAFFQKHLENPGSSEDLKVELFEVEDLWVTEHGNVYQDLGGMDMHGLVNDIIDNSEEVAISDAEVLRKKLIEKTGYSQGSDEHGVWFSGRIQEEKYDIEKYLLQGAGDYFFPLLYLKPKEANGSRVLLLDDDGKRKVYEKGQLVADLVNDGYEVVMPDLSGFGEMGAGLDKGDAVIQGVTLNLWYAGILTAKSLSAVRMEELDRLVSFMGGGSFDYVVGNGLLCSDVLQYLSVSNKADNVILYEPLISWKSMIEERSYDPSFAMHAPAGAVRTFDLPDLLQFLPADKLVLVNPIDGSGQRLSTSEIKHYYQTVSDKRKDKGLNPLQFFGDKDESTIIDWINK